MTTSSSTKNSDDITQPEVMGRVERRPAAADPQTSETRRSLIKRGLAALPSLALGETILLSPDDSFAASSGQLYGQRKAQRRPNGKGRLKNDYSKAKLVRSVCLNCSTVCGIEAYVINDKVVKVGGNPDDPNNGLTLCAKGQSGPTIEGYPERLLYPLKRVGARGSGQWQRVSWDEAYTQIAKRIRTAIDMGKPDEVAIHIGRSRIGTEMNRFLSAIGSPSLFNHRALCSSNKRASNYVCLGETDWESVDAERCKYFLNFGSNFYEAHQGAIHVARRIVKGRYDNGAKLVTFDVRLSNTAGRSDEWLAPNPGSEGAIALGMAHAIMDAGQYDREFLEKWCNVGPEQLHRWLKDRGYTPQWAATLSGLEAADIRRLALEFAAQRPRCAAFTNRGSGAHYNGFNNDRAVIMLNAITGSIGVEGGYCYGTEPGVAMGRLLPDVGLRPPPVKAKSAIENPPEWPLANRWQRMKVGQIVYEYLKQGRGKCQVYMSYTLAAPTTWPEGRSLAVDVLKNEKLIEFHVCSDIVYSETAHYADLIIPDASYFERWGFDNRNNLELRDYVSLRQPIVAPPGECISFVDSMIEIAKRVGPDVSKYLPFKNHEDWVRQRSKALDPLVGGDGFEHLKSKGVFVDMRKGKSYRMFDRDLSANELKDTRVDPLTNIIYRKTASAEAGVGIMMDGKAKHGFPTPSRKFSVSSDEVAQAAKEVNWPDVGWPDYIPVPSIQMMKPHHLHLVSFKWNVHTQGRTAQQKYLTEIVHHNPLWINTDTAARYGIRSGDLVEITTWRAPAHALKMPTEGAVGSAVVPAFVTEGIHPRVIAMSNSLGQQYHGRAATAKRGTADPSASPAFDRQLIEEDADLAEDLWWDPRRGGTGAGYNINAILPIYPTPLVGMQGWYDAICSIRKV